MTRIWIIILLSGFWTIDCLGQESPCDSLFTVVDKEPLFAKEKKGLLEYFGKNLKFNNACKADQLIRLTWTINKEGKMIDIDAVGLEGQCKADLISQLKTFPIWSPGRLKGKLVCVKMTLPMHTSGLRTNENDR